MANNRAPTPQDTDPIVITVQVPATVTTKNDPSGGHGEVKKVTLTSTDSRFVDGVIYVGEETEVEFVGEFPGESGEFTDFRWTRSCTADELRSPPSDLGKWFEPSNDQGDNRWGDPDNCDETGNCWPYDDEFRGTKPSSPSATTMTVTDKCTSATSDHTYLFILEWTEETTQETRTYVSSPVYKIKQSNPPRPHK